MFSERVSLKKHTTMKTGGNARYFFTVKSVEDLKEAVSFAKEKNAPIFILGGGSNVLVSDEGFKGVVVKMEIVGINFISTNENTVRVTAGAGVEWDSLVREAVNKNLYGLENLSLIPGTVGAAPVQNIGAYGVEVKDVIEWVEVLNTSTMEIERITNTQCSFGYRDSFFKSERTPGKDRPFQSRKGRSFPGVRSWIFKSENAENFIILKVAFELKKNENLICCTKILRSILQRKTSNQLLSLYVMRL